MSARLTVTVSGKVRWVNITPASIIQRALDKIIPEAYAINQIVTPRRTGRLQDSFYDERSERSVRFYFDAPYARYVDQGTRPSPGRYVPALGKRLVNARRMGMHPGVRPRHFVQYISDYLRPFMLTYTYDAVKEGLL